MKTATGSSSDRESAGFNVPEVVGSNPASPSQSRDSSAVEHQPDVLEVASSDSRSLDHLHRKWEIRLGEDHACATGVYLRRWRVETPWFSVRLHHWLHSDDDRHRHDHPWAFITFCLRGSYIDEGIGFRQRVRAGHAYYRPADHAHWVHLDRGPAWTVIVTGPKVRRWGFWVNNRWVKSYRYFYRFGNHPCD